MKDAKRMKDAREAKRLYEYLRPHLYQEYAQWHREVDTSWISASRRQAEH